MAKKLITEADLSYSIWSQYLRVNTPEGLNPGYVWSRDDGNGWQIYQGPSGSDYITFTRRTSGAADLSILTLTRNRNLLLGGYGEPGGDKVFGLMNGTAPTYAIGGVHIWAESGEFNVRDNAGNVTTLSPHHLDQVDIDPDDSYPVAIHHQNRYTGQEETIYLSKLARLVEQLTGQQIIYKRTMSRQEIRDFQSDELTASQVRDAEIQAYDNHRAEVERLPSPDRERLLANLPSRPPERDPVVLPDWVIARIPQT